MTITTLSSREFNQDTSRAKKAAENGPVIAATALVHGMSVVTRNVADFVPTGVALFNPWVAVTPG